MLHVDHCSDAQCQLYTRCLGLGALTSKTEVKRAVPGTLSFFWSLESKQTRNWRVVSKLVQNAILHVGTCT